LKLGIIGIHNMSINNVIKKWGDRACSCDSTLLKWGTVTGWDLKNSNDLHTELSLGYLKDAKLKVKWGISYFLYALELMCAR